MKYDEKRKAIREYLETTHFPGKKLPPEKELAERFDTNLGMIREILRELEILGVIRKHLRQGNFLNTSVLRTHARLDDNCSFLALIQEQGYQVSQSRKRIISPVPHEKEALEILDCSNRKELITLQEIYYADDNPAILSYFYCPSSLLGDVLWEEIGEDTEKLAQLISQKTYPEFDHSVNHLSSVIAPKEASALLQLGDNVPVIFWKERYYNIYDELTSVSYNYLHPDYMDLAFVRKRPNSINIT